MKRLSIVILLLLGPALVKAQGQQITAGPFPKSGLLYVCPVPSGGTPCPSPSSIFSDTALSQALGNPINIAAQTTVTFYAASGQYTLEMPASGIQQVVGGSSSVGGGGTTTKLSNISALGTGLIGEYAMQATENPCALVDVSGAGNNATGCTGTSPTIIALTGGVTCPGNGAIVLPAALNAAKSIMTYQTFQPGANTFNATVAGNGNGSSGNSVGLLLWQQGGLNFQGNGTILGLKTGVTTGASFASALGTNTIGLALDSSVDKLYLNGVQPDYILTHSGSQGFQTLGAYQICGSSIGLSASTYFTGPIYYAAFWNRELSDTEFLQASNFIVNLMNLRGIAQSLQTNATTDMVAIFGDSITAGQGVTTPFSNAMTLQNANGSWTVINMGIASRLAQTEATLGAIDSDPLLRPVSAAARNMNLIFLGTNDITAGKSAAQVMDYEMAWCTNRRKAGWTKIGLATMISRTGQDTGKNNLDALERQYWHTCFDFLADFASNPNIGADGANASATFFQVDNVHPTQGTHYNVMTPIVQHAFNAAYGNLDFSTANTYTTTATAANTITAASESTNTVTLTFAANAFTVGQCITVAGVTPAGYNSPANTCWLVLTSTATQVTYYNWTTGLGAGTVFGTAIAPQEADADVYAILGGSGAGLNHTLQSCIGRTGQPIYRRITNTNAWTITPIASTETINGGATFTTPVASAGNNPIVKLESILTSSSASGCTWKASLQ